MPQNKSEQQLKQQYEPIVSFIHPKNKAYLIGSENDGYFSK